MADLIVLEFRTQDASAQEACRQYWTLDEKGGFPIRVRDIAPTLGVGDQAVTATIADLCRAKSSKSRCESCDTPYVYRGRSDFKIHARLPARRWKCSACVERQGAEEAAQKERERAAQRERIHRFYDYQHISAPEATGLELDRAIYLLSLFRLGGNESQTAISPVRNYSAKLAPDEDSVLQILRELYLARVLVPDPESPVEAFFWEDEEPKQFDLYQVHWRVPGTDARVLGEITRDLEAMLSSGSWNSSWKYDVRNLWLVIGKWEIVDYLCHTASRYHFDFKPGERTSEAILTLLEQFSIGQVLSLVWRAGRDTAAWRQEKGISAEHAGNSLVPAMRRMADRAVANHSDVKPFSRRPLQQTVVSEMFFNSLLQVGERCLDLIPQGMEGPDML